MTTLLQSYRTEDVDPVRLTRVPPGTATVAALPPHPTGDPVPPPRTIPMPAVAVPRVSVVVPVHGQLAVTLRCLASLATVRCDVPFEVVVVDDASPDETGAVVADVPNVAVWRTSANVGYLRAVNLGMEQARGEYACLLNNDVEVTDGWLDALVETLDRDPTVALAGAKLLYPDGWLQEAGGVVFRDGSGCNYGRRDSPHRPQYDVPRDVDYCSAAALLVRRAFWDEVGGYDERYAPAYYEDTDLAFAARARGYRVRYQPRAVVYHHEGASHGTDEASGTKAYQARNRVRFVTKWQAALTQQHAGPERLAAARCRGGGQRVLVVDDRLPRPDRDSGRLRTWQVVHSLVRQGARVSVLPLDGRDDAWSDVLRDYGVEVLVGQVDMGAYLPFLDPDLVLLVRPSAMAAYLVPVRSLCPRATVIYDTVDLHHVRLGRQQALTGDASIEPARRAYLVLEAAYTDAADVTLALSTEERDLLRALRPAADVRILSNVNDEQPYGPGRAARDGVLFVGNHEHPPNRDAAIFLATEVMPLVWAALPDVPLVLAGAEPPAEVRALAGPRVAVPGWLPDLGPVYARACVVAAPLRYGAGVKGKVTEALSYGVPVVTTAVGAEGTGLADGASALLGESAADLADAIVRLHRDRALWLRLAAAARLRARASFSTAAADQVVAGLLATSAGRR